MNSGTQPEESLTTTDQISPENTRKKRSLPCGYRQKATPLSKDLQLLPHLKATQGVVQGVRR